MTGPPPIRAARASASARAYAAASTVTATQATPRARSAASGRTHDGSSEAVMMTAVIPRRSRPTDPMSVSTSGVRGVGFDGRQQLHDLLVLAAPAVRRQVRGPAGVHRHADGPVLVDGLVGDRGGRPDRGLGRGLLAAARLDAALEVEDDPGVGGLLEVELLDLDLAVPGRRLPVDAVHAVARGVGPDAWWRAVSSGASAPARRGCPRGSRREASTSAAARAAGRRRR